MRLSAVGLLVVPAIVAEWFPAGFLWNMHSEMGDQPHSPYVYMLVAMYVPLVIMLWIGAKNPREYRLVISYAIWANLLHGLVMLVQSIWLEHELAHLAGDVPLALVIAAALAYCHPDRVS